MGRRPELKSEEFSFVHHPFMRYQGVNTYSQLKKWYRLLEHQSEGNEGRLRADWIFNPEALRLGWV